jgi:RNA-directed DNA polymerase
VLRNLNSVSPKQHRIAELAKRSPELVFTSLAHLIDFDWLLEAYRRTRKDGAMGVDGQTAAGYEADLTSNLQSLLDRVHSGTYRAPPVRRVQIPKGTSSETRPIGIPTFEDKLLQRAVLMLLESIYEQDFSDCSYGFRPGRSTHQAIDTTWKHTIDLWGGFVLEVDLRKFFDTLDHGHLRTFLQRRVRDGVVQRLIGKWPGTDRRLVTGRHGIGQPKLPGSWQSAGWGDFAVTGERLSSLCSGRMVSQRCCSVHAWSSPLGSVRG